MRVTSPDGAEGGHRFPPTSAAVEEALLVHERVLRSHYRCEPAFWQLLFDTTAANICTHTTTGRNPAICPAEAGTQEAAGGPSARRNGQIRLSEAVPALKEILIILVLVLVSASLIPRIGATTDGLKEREREFRAFDCSRPINLTTLTQSRSKTCQLPTPEVKQTSKTFRLVQEVQRVRFKVKGCRARRSRVAYHCYYDDVISYHVFPLIREWFFNRLYPILILECDQMWKQKKFIGPYRPKGDHTYTLNTPGRTHLTNPVWGDIYYTEGKSEGRPGCQGQNHWPIEAPSVWGGYMKGDSDKITHYQNAAIYDFYVFDLWE